MSENEKDQDLIQPADSAAGDDLNTEITGEPADTVSGDKVPFENDADVKNGQSTVTGAGAPTNPYAAPPFPPYVGQYQYPPQQPPQQQPPRPQQPYYYNNPNQPPFYGQPQNPATAQYGSFTPPPPKGKKKGMKIFYSALGVLLVFALIVTGFSIGRNSINTSNDGNSTTADTTGDGPSLVINKSTTSAAQPASGTLTPEQVAAKVKPSVVGVLDYSSNSTTATGEGSGIVIGPDSSGKYTYILTCAHVISDAGVSISIQLDDGTKYKAALVGFDVRTDVGVVKIKATGLPAAEFGDSDQMQVGDQVFAIGNPGGTEFADSFTGGYVSAIDRPINSDIGYTMECIQHDAAINPGNSGGALANTSGQVVGINSLKIADTSYEGMGFAIPITQAKPIINDLIKYGYVPNRPKLGITYLAASSSQTYSMIVQIKGLPSGSLYINAISSDSGLANTKAQVGDLIIAVNGKNLDTANVLLEIIDKGKVGDTITLTLCRINSSYQTTEFKVKVKLVEDKGNTATQATTETTTDAYDYFNNPWGN